MCLIFAAGGLPPSVRARSLPQAGRQAPLVPLQACDGRPCFLQLVATISAPGALTNSTVVERERGGRGGGKCLKGASPWWVMR